MLASASLLFALAAVSAAPPPAPTITLCGKPQAQVLTASLAVMVEVFGADDGTPANPVARFDNVRVHYGIEASTLDPDRSGEDGGLEPTLGLFEPLGPDGRYFLPWQIPAGTKLVEDDRWGGWDAWLGNDNDGIGENTLEFIAVSRDRVEVRWQGRIDGDCEFLLEGEMPIGDVRVSAPGDADIDAVLATVFGDIKALGARVTVERNVDKWTKTPRLAASITPK